MAEGLWPTRLYGLKWYGGKAETALTDSGLQPPSAA